MNYKVEHDEMLSECDHCDTWVYYTEINRETNYLCDECKKIDFCDCGEVRKECSFCSMPLFWRLFEKTRANIIYKLKNLI